MRARTRIPIFFLLVMFCSISNNGFASDLSQIQLALAELIDISKAREDSNETKLQRLKDVFSQTSSSIQNPGTVETNDLRAIFSAAELVYNYVLTYGDKDTQLYLSSMQVTYAELRRRGVERHGETLDILKSLIASRQWEQARALRANEFVDGRLVVPRLSSDSQLAADGPAALFLSTNEDELSLQNIAMDARYRIIVVSGCRTSDKAAKSIDSNVLVRDAFIRGNAIWLAAASKELDLVEIRSWNRQFPRQKIAIAYDNSKWPGIDFSRVPTFYFYKDRQLIFSHRGWPKDNSIPPEMLDALHKMSLLTGKPEAGS
ncbi:MAG TPA: hypothetical protein VF471_09670 [Pseudoxanthomonas sp.]